MKWIGQHIWDQVSRFREHTYFDNNITLRTSKSITMDEYTSGTISITKIQDSGTTFADNDTSLMTAAAIADKIEAYGYSTTAGDITGVTAGTNLSGGGASGAVTINLADASTSAKGAASFSSGNFAVSSGAVTIAEGGVALANIAAAAIVTEGERIASNDNDENIPTSAAVKDYVDNSYSKVYLTFTFKAQNIPSDCWVSPSSAGPNDAAWTNTHGSGETQASSGAPSAVDTSATISVDYLDQPSGWVIPEACILTGFYGNIRVNGTDPNTLRPVLGLFRAAEPADGNTSDVTATCVAFDKYDTASGNRKNRFLKLTSTHSANLSAGDLLFPAVGFDATANDDLGDAWGSFTIVLKKTIG